MPSQPLVSVLINNYNYGRFLRFAIDSALAQTYKHIEVVVVDDGSTDDSASIIRSYGSRVVPVLKENGGQATAYNAGFAASKGEILCLLDSDDLFDLSKVQTVVDILEEDLSLGWCFDLVQEFESASGVRTKNTAFWRPGPCDARALTLAGKPPYVATASSGLSFRRRLLGQIFPMPPLMKIATGSSSDAYIKWIALALEKGWMCGEELSLMRIHDSNAYTRRLEGKTRLGGQIEIFTGVCLYEEWPTLRRLGIKVFSKGLSKMWETGGLDKSSAPRVQSFLHELPPLVRLEARARALFWFARKKLAA